MATLNLELVIPDSEDFADIADLNENFNKIDIFAGETNEKLEKINSGGASTFLELSDTPEAYSGNSGKIVSVNSTATELEFKNASELIGSNEIVNSKLAQAPAYTIKGNNTVSLGNVKDLTIEEVRELITDLNNRFVTDTERTYWNSLVVGIGIGQTWQDVSSSRSKNITYTNTTGKTIFLCLISGQASAQHLEVIVDGIVLCFVGAYNMESYIPFSVPIPPNSTYRVTGNNVVTSWKELR